MYLVDSSGIVFDVEDVGEVFSLGDGGLVLDLGDDSAVAGSGTVDSKSVCATFNLSILFESCLPLTSMIFVHSFDDMKWTVVRWL